MGGNAGQASELKRRIIGKVCLWSCFVFGGLEKIGRSFLESEMMTSEEVGKVDGTVKSSRCKLSEAKSRLRGEMDFLRSRQK
jgi:hypothetical protein